MTTTLQVNGKDELRLLDVAAGFKPRPLPGLPAGSIGSMAFRPGADELAFTVNSAQGPSQVFNGWVKIASDDTVTVMVPKSEMGQGVLTSLAMGCIGLCGLAAMLTTVPRSNPTKKDKAD